MLCHLSHWRMWRGRLAALAKAVTHKRVFSAEVDSPKPHGAEDGSRTRDLELGKLTLYQLSYFRIGASDRIRTCEPLHGKEVR